MISVNDFKTGVTIELDGNVWSVIEFMHVKPGKGSAFVRSKLKNLETGATIERTFRGGEKVPRARLDHKKMQYLYNDGESYYFMDEETYEQIFLSKEQLGDGILYLLENMVIEVLMHGTRTIGIDLPNFVEMTIVESEPGIRGDTATGATKIATLETGATVHVPLFLEVGDKVRIDTRTGDYMERVSK